MTAVARRRRAWYDSQRAQRRDTAVDGPNVNITARSENAT